MPNLDQIQALSLVGGGGAGSPLAVKFAAGTVRALAVHGWAKTVLAAVDEEERPESLLDRLEEVESRQVSQFTGCVTIAPGTYRFRTRPKWEESAPSLFVFSARLAEKACESVDRPAREQLLTWVKEHLPTATAQHFEDEPYSEEEHRTLVAAARAKDIITRLSTASEIGEDVAVEVATDQINQQLKRGVEGAAAIDAFLKSVNPKRFSKAVLSAVLTSTAAADVQGLLSARKDFSQAVMASIAKRDGAQASQEMAAKAQEEAMRARALVAERNAKVGQFLDEVYRLGEGGDLQQATDKVFQYIDDLLLADELVTCDEILRRVDAKRLPTALLRSFLTITAPVKEHLRNRDGFYREAFAAMVRLKGDVAKAQKLLGRLA